MTSPDLQQPDITALAAHARSDRWALGWSLLAVATTSAALLCLIWVAALNLAR